MIGRAIVPNGSARGASGGDLGLECRAIVPNGSARGASGGVLGLECRAIVPNGSARRSSGSDLGLECRAIVPNGSARGASGGVLGFSAVTLTGYGALRLRSIEDNRSTMARKRRRLRFFRLLLSLATVHSGSDRLGTIDLPWLASGGGLAVSFFTSRIAAERWRAMQKTL
jgi:hypothetical protein